MARAGMANVIAYLRSLASAETAEATIDNVSYWTDDQLQSILDRHSRYVDDVKLVVVPISVNGVVQYKSYFFSNYIGQWFDEGTYSVVDTLGAAAPTNTVSFPQRSVTFAASTGGLSYFLRGVVFDVRAAAAEVWLTKAGHRFDLFDTKDGTHTLSEDQVYQHCMAMYREFAGGGIKTVTLRRIDYAFSRGARYDS